MNKNIERYNIVLAIETKLKSVLSFSRTLELGFPGNCVPQLLHLFVFVLF